jgi:hypothetical protein
MTFVFSRLYTSDEENGGGTLHESSDVGEMEEDPHLESEHAGILNASVEME